MKKLTGILAVIFTVIALTGCFEPPYTPPTGADTNFGVYVVNNGSTSISVIDLEEDSVYNNVALVGVYPNQLTYRDGKLYCVNSGSDNITIHDVSTWIAETPIALGANNNPMNMVFYSDDVAYVACSVSGVVLKIDMNTKSVVDTLVAGAGCTGITIANGKVYASNTGYVSWDQPYLPGTVNVFDAATGDSITVINVGLNPQSIVADATGKLHVLCTGDYGTINVGSVSVIDPSTDAVTATYSIGSTPGGLAIDPVNNLGFGSVWGMGAIAYNTTNGTVTDSIFAGHGGSGIMYFDNGIWLSDASADKVYKYSSTGTVIDSFVVGDSPMALTYRNDTQE